MTLPILGLSILMGVLLILFLLPTSIALAGG